MNFFYEIEKLILSETYQDKIENFDIFYKNYIENRVVFDHKYPIKDFDKPSYEAFCKIVPPQKVPKRSNFATKEGKAKLLHAIAHIEFSAIDLALDAVYRFRDLPKKFYDDWIEVAKDEVYHFELINNILKELGYRYGDFEVHNSLFEASYKTRESLLERMAIVPRYLEANGLDATPKILKKIEIYKDDPVIDKISKALKIILKEEISHVQKGDFWFKWACKKENKDTSIYFNIVKHFYPNEFKKSRDLNLKDRKNAGFSCDELKKFDSKIEC